MHKFYPLRSRKPSPSKNRFSPSFEEQADEKSIQFILMYAASLEIKKINSVHQGKWILN